MQYKSNRPANPCLDFQEQMWLGTATSHGARGCVVHGAWEHFSEQLPRLWNLRWTPATTNQPCHWEFSEPTFRISSEGQPSTHVYIQVCRKYSLCTLVSALKGNMELKITSKKRQSCTKKTMFRPPEVVITQKEPMCFTSHQSRSF